MTQLSFTDKSEPDWWHRKKGPNSRANKKWDDLAVRFNESLAVSENIHKAGNTPVFNQRMEQLRPIAVELALIDAGAVQRAMEYYSEKLARINKVIERLEGPPQNAETVSGLIEEAYRIDYALEVMTDGYLRAATSGA